MVGDDIHDGLWKEINALKDKVSTGFSQVGAQVASILTLLEERCETRSKTIGTMQAQIKALEDKYNVLDRQLVRLVVTTGFTSAIVSSAATATVIKLFGLFIGG